MMIHYVSFGPSKLNEAVPTWHPHFENAQENIYECNPPAERISYTWSGLEFPGFRGQ